MHLPNRREVGGSLGGLSVYVNILVLSCIYACYFRVVFRFIYIMH